MIVIPAVDLREGHCVQLVGGSYDREAIRFDDPVEVALRWQRSGFPALHVVPAHLSTPFVRGSLLREIRRSVNYCALGNLARLVRDAE